MAKFLKEIGKDEFGRSIYREENSEPITLEGCLFTVFILGAMILLVMIISFFSSTSGETLIAILYFFGIIIGIALIIWLGYKFKILK